MSLGPPEKVDCRYNWWGHPSGPSSSELNPEGKGDRLVVAHQDGDGGIFLFRYNNQSQYVDHQDWLTDPPGGKWEDGKDTEEWDRDILFGLISVLLILFGTLGYVVKSD